MILALLCTRLVLAAPLPAGVSIAPVDAAPPAFDALAASAEVLGIGESIHLSGGLERARARLAERALTGLGFQALAMEVSWVEGRAVDAQLRACATDPAAGVAVPFEDLLWAGVRPLLQRVCAHNGAHPEAPIRFFGIDIQDAWNHRRMIEAAMGAPDPALRGCHGAQVRCSRDLRSWGEREGFPPPTPDGYARCKAHLAKLAAADLDPNAAAAVESLQVGAETTWQHYAQGDTAAAYDAREAGMATAFRRERARVGGGRVVLLAHNDHLARRLDAYRPLGARLADDSPYVAVAVSGFRVESRLGGGITAPPSARPAAADEWHDLGEPRLFIEFSGSEQPHDAMLFVDHAPAD